MPERQYKDAITYEPKFVEIIKEKERIDLLKDENILLLLKILRFNKNPMTIEDLETGFREKGNQKSIKTIYRYLSKLENANLITHAGKRVLSVNNKIRTQTLYTRTARIFLPHFDPSEEMDFSPEKKSIPSERDRSSGPTRTISRWGVLKMSSRLSAAGILVMDGENVFVANRWLTENEKPDAKNSAHQDQRR